LIDLSTLARSHTYRETELEQQEAAETTGTDDEQEVSTLRPNRFRPKAGTRSRLRSVLHEALKEENEDEQEEDEEIQR
jgi:hypothetical protein